MVAYKPKYAPEWGSGGIFGLLYHKGVLYYTVAFDAEAHFVFDDDREKIYKFTRVGRPPRSGGDTYNASVAVDDEIYFGGWIHAPAQLKNGILSFKHKYSHIHLFDLKTEKVKLLWKESLHSDYLWAGEVSSIIYNPIQDDLLVARGDGFANLGIFRLNRRGKKLNRIGKRGATRGRVWRDSAYFDLRHLSPFGGLYHGIQVVDLDRERVVDTLPFEAFMKLDDGSIRNPQTGDFAVTHDKLMLFTRGGVFVLPDRIFIRLLDLPGYSPVRANALHFAGGVLVAYNAFAENRFEACGPTLLLFVSPPRIKIIASFGARITSMEKMKSKLLIATNTAPNLSRLTTKVDYGYKQINFFDENLLWQQPPLEFVLAPKTRVFGGIPLYGYKEANLTYLGKSNRVILFYYDFKGSFHRDEFALRKGDEIDLLTAGIVSFKFQRKENRNFVVTLR